MAARVIGLRDSSFKDQLSLSLAGDNCEEAPQFIQWDHDADTETVVFTDMHLWEAKEHKGRSIALLVEPPRVDKDHHAMAYGMRNYFDAILMPWQSYAQHFPSGYPVHYYPTGGSWIAPEKWGLREKNMDFSIIVSEKTGTEGHKLRYKVKDAFAEKHHIDVWGRGIRPTTSKFEALAPYQYTIVIESMRLKGYFTEKLIDAISVGCVPLYWGDPEIHRTFPGLPTWNTIEQLELLLLNLPTITSEVQMAWLDTAAQKHRCAEDWIYQNTGVFNG